MQSDNPFPLYDNFHTKMKRKKMKKLNQFLKTYFSEIPGAIYLKFETWGTDSGGHLHSKNRLVLYKQQEITYT